MSKPPSPTVGRLVALGKRGLRWCNNRPAASAALLLFLFFALYLARQEPTQFYYDAGLYWDLSGKYWQSGDFQFIAFDSFLRGYLFPLLLGSLWQLLIHTSVLPLEITRTLGAATAAILFGVVAPGLWQDVRKHSNASRVSLARRLLFGALGFAFWRGYFHYPLTDFISLLALAGGLWTVVRGRAVWSGVLAGMLVAASVNFRPVYAAAVPVVFILCLWPASHDASYWRTFLRQWGKTAALALGMAIVLWPQVIINTTHFGVASPLVLTTKPGTPSLYLTQLKWGLWYQKYETNVGTDYPVPTMFFLDEDGRAVEFHRPHRPGVLRHVWPADTFRPHHADGLVAAAFI
ncbi:hypothetical protein [Hymenobacter armeniacus]|uniref:Glycosyltransferase RgtA/B/C/D-like domain-containing protein n=1 Tax=Hymenobacter armeniacus TaxID=2771358 RepID=A0ABR8JVV8_9BACT|nr:hypothetical protein [Hymenobacter armeniacus]MBD2723447.1 hypothetical protein [Hymenobacter armeniacus]